MSKVTIVGAGNVGSQAAFYLALKSIVKEIVILDIIEGVPQGKALDLQEAMPIAGSNVKITGSNDYSTSKDSEIVVITAGVPRKPGMTRDDLLSINSKIITSVVKEVVKHSPNCILIIVTNPLDAMVYKAQQVSNFPKNRVIGMAGVLDTARFRTFIADELNADVKKVEALVLGGHGDSMVPVIKSCTVNDKPITELLSPERIKEIVERVRNGGVEIVNLLKTGSAFFAPGLAIAEMVGTIIQDQKKLLPCSVLLNGEYGFKEIFMGVPVVLGKDGVEKVVEVSLSDQEKVALTKSAGHVKELIEALNNLKDN
ncbi:malate dehydrogenase [Candidatus Woesearchaeota archaeon CG_4_10_14_0_2_um_filter_33_13]|nr:MAG: malate dehydrogenase [Candidatus Woesearchaeota archaeon CG_4_10_14_0_2_um_filter_33_13]